MVRSAGHEFECVIDHGEPEPLVVGNVCPVRGFQVDGYAIAVGYIKLVPHELRAKSLALCFGAHAGDD